MLIKYSRRFAKDFRRVPRNIQTAFKDRVILFVENKFHPFLNNHNLSGELKEYRSINITGDWRAVYKELDGGEIVFFSMLGTHSQLYK